LIERIGAETGARHAPLRIIPDVLQLPDVQLRIVPDGLSKQMRRRVVKSRLQFRVGNAKSARGSFHLIALTRKATPRVV
jgi:hypothetical protein